MSRKPRRGERSKKERLLLQQNLQPPEEVTRRREETMRLFLQDKLQKEQKNSAENLLKLNQGWRQILLQTRDSELRQDLLVLQQTFERHLDQLNSTIKKMVCELQEAELQAAQEQQSHLQQVDLLWTQQETHLKTVQQLWDGILQDFSSISSSEKDQVVRGVQQQRTQLEDEQLLAKRHAEETADQDKTFYGLTLDRLLGQKDGLMEVKTDIKPKKKGPEDCRSLVRHYIEEHKKNICRDRRMVAIKQTAASRLVNILPQLKSTMETMLADRGLQSQELSLCLKTTRYGCVQLKEQLLPDRQAARRKLLELSNQSAAATKKLQEVISKGQEVLHVAELCRKLQSKQELPTMEHGQTSCESELQHLLSVALLHREHLRNQQLDLSRQNHQLDLLLQQARHGCPLLVSSALSTSVPPAAGRRHNIIQAAHSVQNCL